MKHSTWTIYCFLVSFQNIITYSEIGFNSWNKSLERRDLWKFFVSDFIAFVLPLKFFYSWWFNCLVNFVFVCFVSETFPPVLFFKNLHCVVSGTMLPRVFFSIFTWRFLAAEILSSNKNSLGWKIYNVINKFFCLETIINHDMPELSGCLTI